MFIFFTLGSVKGGEEKAGFFPGRKSIQGDEEEGKKSKLKDQSCAPAGNKRSATFCRIYSQSSVNLGVGYKSTQGGEFAKLPSWSRAGHGVG